jgi:hypothetical protein
VGSTSGAGGTGARGEIWVITYSYTPAGGVPKARGFVFG